MQRFEPKGEDVHDLLVVGGGIYGATLAYTAALNQIKTVLVEKDDFVSHASANSQKVIHCGLRYLQSLDLKRVIESIRERQRFYYLFPHLVQPMECVLPTSGYTTSSNEAFQIAFLLFRFLQRLVGKGKLSMNLDKKPHLLSKKELTDRFPHLKDSKHRGGALWYDGLCLDPERVIMSLLDYCAENGAAIANYMKLVDIRRVNNTTLESTVFDRLQRKEFTLRSRKVALCTGTWFHDQYRGIARDTPNELKQLTLIRGLNVIVPKLFSTKTSFATKLKDQSESRYLFMVPWKNWTIAGTHWELCEEKEKEAGFWADKTTKVNNFAGLIQKTVSGITPDLTVLTEHVGCVPGMASKDQKESGAGLILPHYKLVDREANNQGDVLQIVGVKFTTAFDVSLNALKTLFKDRTIKDILEVDTLYPSRLTENKEDYFLKLTVRYNSLCNKKILNTLYQLVGTKAGYICEQYLYPLQENQALLPERLFYEGMTRYCVQEEMCAHLNDLIYRRLFPNTPQPPEDELLNNLAEIMAELLCWNPEIRDIEIKRVRERSFPNQ